MGVVEAFSVVWAGGVGVDVVPFVWVERMVEIFSVVSVVG